jgi:predicted PurR-regulated permease PerM
MTGPSAPTPHEAPAPVPSTASRAALQVILIVGLVALGLWVLYRLQSLVLLLTLAAVFAYIVAPLVRLAQRPVPLAGRRRQLPRGLAIALVYLLLGGCATAGVLLLLPIASEQAHDMIARAPSYAQSIAAWQHGWSREYERLRIPVTLRHSIDEGMTSMGEAAFESTRATIVALVVAVLPWTILTPVLSFFLLKDAAALRRLVLTALPHRVQLRGHQLFEEANATLAAYIRAQLLACLLVGTACGVGFAALGIPYAVLLGVLAGVLEFIPLVGPLLVALAAAIVGALHAPILAVWALTFLGLLRLVQDYVVFPRLMRRGVRLHPLAVIVAVLAGAALAGVVGMFLAVPVAAMASVFGRHLIGWRRIEADRLESIEEPSVLFRTA